MECVRVREVLPFQSMVVARISTNANRTEIFAALERHVPIWWEVSNVLVHSVVIHTGKVVLEIMFEKVVFMIAIVNWTKHVSIRNVSIHV